MEPEPILGSLFKKSNTQITFGHMAMKEKKIKVRGRCPFKQNSSSFRNIPNNLTCTVINAP